MVVQLPDGALAAAVGVQIYSFVCLICSSLIILLVWKHRERDSYVALLAYSTFISTTASIAQQLHTIIRWDEVKTEQFYYVQDHIGSPELATAGPSYGLDLVLYYIQYYCYNVEGILTVSWAFVLAYSVFKTSEINWHQRISQRSSIIAKAVAFVLPAVFIGLLHIPAVRSSIAVFITLANFQLAASFTIGGILLIAILFKYIQTRRKLHRWTVRFPLPGTLSANNEGEDEQDLNSEESIYDSWLIVRFVISLLFIEAFQILTILSEVAQINNNKKEALPSEPDLSAAHARVDFIEFIPGVTAGLLVFVVFGTTQTCKRTMIDTFFPRRFRRPEAPSADPPTSILSPRRGLHTRSLTSSSIGRSSRRTAEFAPTQLDEEQALPQRKPSCPVLERRGSRFTVPRTADLIENQLDSIDACSISSAEPCKLVHQGNGRDG
ncbi:hypothetical protein F5Y10DRAFT_240457 [Nemania abortiva]|nr:hypothetical protein F5Y10DRAFT_240457 [Nemania abortiva]